MQELSEDVTSETRNAERQKPCHDSVVSIHKGGLMNRGNERLLTILS